jgi:hypothetical protein
MEDWIPSHVETGSEPSATATMLAGIQPHFTKAEQTYIAKWVQEIKHYPFTGDEAGVGGYHHPTKHYIAINSTRPLSGIPFIDEMKNAKFTLAHELSHPVYALAGQDGYNGHLIINPIAREIVREKTAALFPNAIAKMNAALNDSKTLETMQPSDFSPEESVAMLTFMMLDRRYYDLFGDAYAAKYTGRGYSAFDRNNEVACNLRALQICEADMVGKPTDIVERIAGEIIDSLKEKVVLVSLKWLCSEGLLLRDRAFQ